MSTPPSPYVPSAPPPDSPSPAPAGGPAAAPYGPAAAPYGPTTNVPGRVSLAFGVVVILIGVLSNVYAIALPRVAEATGSTIAAAAAPLNVASWVNVCLALVAVVTGIMGLSRRGAPKAAAGAGTAIGVSALISLFVAMVVPLFLR